MPEIASPQWVSPRPWAEPALDGRRVDAASNAAVRSVRSATSRYRHGPLRLGSDHVLASPPTRTYASPTECLPGRGTGDVAIPKSPAGQALPCIYTSPSLA
jgi:hypothetical protein